MDPIAIFLSQLFLVFLKHIAIRTIAQNKIFLTLIYTALIQSFWLISSALGINALLNNEWISVAAYIVGGVIGSLLQFAIKIKKKRRIYERRI